MSYKQQETTRCVSSLIPKNYFNKVIKLDKEAPYIISNYKGAQLIATSINCIVLIDLLQRPEAIATTPKKVTRVRSRDDSDKRAGVQF